jgi:transposase-like protein
MHIIHKFPAKLNTNWFWYLDIAIYYDKVYLCMNCPRCKSSNHTKNGIVGGRQRYKCHDCGYNYSVEIKSNAFPISVKRQALQLYLEGLGFRSIGRFLGVSHVSVQKWIKKFGPEFESLKSENEISIVELDEMHTYIGNKKNIAGSGLLLIELGKSSSPALLVAEERKLGNYSGKN